MPRPRVIRNIDTPEAGDPPNDEQAPSHTEEADEQDASADLGAAFAGLAALFQGGSVKRAEAKKALDTGLAAINKALADNPDLAKDPAVWEVFEKIEDAQRAQSTELAPGTIRRLNEFISDKVDWHWRHLKEPPPEYRPGGAKFGQPLPKGCVEWVYGVMPLEKQEVIWNGLRAVFFPEIPYTGPKCFWDIYLESRRATRVAHQHAEYMLNGGGIPEDPTVVSVHSQAVRAAGHRIPGMPNGYQPGRGTQGFTRVTEGEEAPEAEGA